MKTIVRTIATLLILLTINLITINLYAQDPPPPPPPDHGTGGNVPGGGAPVGSGLLVIIALGAAYGGKKVYDYKQMQRSKQ